MDTPVGSSVPCRCHGIRTGPHGGEPLVGIGQVSLLQNENARQTWLFVFSGLCLEKTNAGENKSRPSRLSRSALESSRANSASIWPGCRQKRVACFCSSRVMNSLATRATEVPLPTPCALLGSSQLQTFVAVTQLRGKLCLG